MSIKRIDQIMQTASEVDAFCLENSNTFQEQMEENKKECVEVVVNGVENYFNYIKEYLDPSQKLKHFREVFDKGRLSVSEFKENIMDPKLKNKIIRNLRELSSLPSIEDLVMDSQDKLQQCHFEFYDGSCYRFEYLYEKFNCPDEFPVLNSLINVDEFLDKKDDIAKESNQFGRVLRVDATPAKTNKKFPSNNSERMKQFEEELTQLKTLNQQTSELLNYLKCFNEDKTPPIKVLNLQGGLVVEQHRTEEGTSYEMSKLMVDMFLCIKNEFTHEDSEIISCPIKEEIESVVVSGNKKYLVVRSTKEEIGVYDLIANTKGTRNSITKISKNKHLSNLAKDVSKFKLLESGDSTYLLFTTPRNKLNLLNLETAETRTLLSDKVLAIESFDDSEVVVFLENLNIKVWDVEAGTWKPKSVQNIQEVRDSIQDMIWGCDKEEWKKLLENNGAKKTNKGNGEILNINRKRMMMNFAVKCPETVFRKLKNYKSELVCVESDNSENLENFANETTESLFSEVHLKCVCSYSNDYELILILKNQKYPNKRIILNLKLKQILGLKAEEIIGKRNLSNQETQEIMGLFFQRSRVFSENKLDPQFLGKFYESTFN
jgi:hypothetical protein